MIRRLPPLLLLAALAAPAHAQRVTAVPRQERNRISAEEVQRSTATDAYQLVQSLRSVWLSRREARLRTTPGPPVRRDPEGPIAQATSPAVQAAQANEAEGADGLIVLLDAALLGGPESLREIPVNRIAFVEFLTPEQARLRYDRRARDGAIVVHTLGAGDR
ncbi:MAG: hypothetical protein ACJ8GN_24065 [Longimicrobiaceae bacterium]